MLQDETPYLKAIFDYIEKKPVRFHYPGHKGNLISLDLTEIPQTDNLFIPEGPLLKAQELSADAFGADYSYFLVNGSTQGIHSAFLSSFKEGDKVLVPFFSHRSIIEGIILTGVKPIFIGEEIDRWGIPQNVRLEGLDRCDNGVKGIVITNPNYFGLTPELKEIVEYAHNRDMIVIVDEAHGAHLHFNKRLPSSGLDAGADIVIQSMHKMGISLTQGAIIHLKGERIDKNILWENVLLLSTTSPSTIILGSIDLCRRELAVNGERILDNLLSEIEKLGYKIKNTGFSLYEKPDMDRTKLTLYDLDGGRLSERLWEDFRIQTEMSSGTYCLFILSLLDSERTLNTLFNALKKIEPLPARNFIPPPGYELVRSPKIAYFSLKEKIKLTSAVGRISGEIITRYPPGVPVVIPGTLITPEIKDYLLLMGREYVSVTLD
ncbi:MAG: aminotransferase class I/II-fold pyridoxal phosphate-dependent enzyme [Dictyoglomi bacterium]|nr:aminotransferase class I/II-fold pyridoxal phosphate-dependent enzyme [Dictyoglomota bacterium]